MDVCLVIAEPCNDFSNHFYALSSRANGHQFFFSTARGRRKSVFIGWDNYTNLLADEVFWKVLVNNFGMQFGLFHYPSFYLWRWRYG